MSKGLPRGPRHPNPAKNAGPVWTMGPALETAGRVLASLALRRTAPTPREWSAVAQALGTAASVAMLEAFEIRRTDHTAESLATTIGTAAHQWLTRHAEKEHAERSPIAHEVPR